MEIYEFIKKDEGEKLKLYKDTLNFWTIGIGHLVSKNPDYNYNISLLDKKFNRKTNGTITELESQQLFKEDLSNVYTAISKSELSGVYSSLDSTRQMALVNMCFQMGVSGVLQFKKAIAAMKNKDWNSVAINLKDSHWYHQTTNRAERIINIFLTGIIK